MCSFWNCIGFLPYEYYYIRYERITESWTLWYYRLKTCLRYSFTKVFIEWILDCSIKSLNKEDKEKKNKKIETLAFTNITTYITDMSVSQILNSFDTTA